MKHISLIVIDPQVGFCSSSGSLGLQYGEEELGEINRALPKIRFALADSFRRHLVRSEYSVGQFTEGEIRHPLANLCVPYKSNDCDVVTGLFCVNYHSSHIKHQHSALSLDQFCSEVDDDLALGVRTFVLAGFLLDYCVKATAEDLCDKLKGTEGRVIVASDLSATRLEKYTNGVVDSTVGALKAKGVMFSKWADI